MERANKENVQRFTSPYHTEDVSIQLNDNEKRKRMRVMSCHCYSLIEFFLRPDEQFFTPLSTPSFPTRSPKLSIIRQKSVKVMDL